ncbi:hypothetical protein MWU65_02130 [Cellulophaga sp. F20128]|uniref:hypothetical protein n=1 Tax=Cellulophaga sp. F20128 TaxID=2926413 RepID=UPI001FF6A3D7|nr:hypothetical protein [Cellulophaga sp. F20128]MCK0155959.1 hypothetical protein [Cellulophaga sp. F20128]
MIAVFLKAKHWQLFVAMLGIPILFLLYALLSMSSDFEMTSSQNPEYLLHTFKAFPVIMILYTVVFFGWFWSIAIGLQKKIPQEIKMKVKKFKILFFIPLIYITLVLIFMDGLYSGMGVNGFPDSGWFVPIILPLHLFSMFSIFYSMYFVAKTIKTAELQTKVGFGDFAGEFIFLWFYFIGIWFIQPQVNKLFEKGNSATNKT